MSPSQPSSPTFAPIPKDGDVAKLALQKKAAISRRKNMNQAMEDGKLSNLPDDRTSFEGM